MSDAVSGFSGGALPVAQGDVLAGKYRVDSILGVGGMGVVVAATHLQLDQKVALKFMLPDALRLPGFVERFGREARAAVRLKSNHVARVLDVGTLSSGSPYMVMEYLEGSDLGSIVERQGRMPVAVAVDCVLQACDAVAEAHSIGIVHRDLKPRNLFMTGRNDGRALVKVLDFGISKTVTGTDLSLTKTTDIIGSPNYMSPEQLKSAKAADERSDIWALGVILYELLTGQVPFVAESVTQLTAMVLMEPPRPIASLRPDVPPGVARVVERCLAKSPAERYASIAELALALQPFAPEDARDLAVRISRIGSAAKGGGATLEAPAAGTLAAPGTTSASWSESGDVVPRPPTTRPVALIVGLVALIVAALVLGTMFAMRSSRSTAGVASGLAAAPPTASAYPSASSRAMPSATLPDLPNAMAVSPSETAPAKAAPEASVVAPAAAPVAPAAASAKHAPRDRPAASAPVDDTPRYRTNW